MHLLLQRWLKCQLPNMHEGHPATAIRRSIIFNNVVGLLLGNHACVGVTSLPWSTETTFAVNEGHRDGIAQPFTLKKMHQGKGLRAGGV